MNDNRNLDGVEYDAIARLRIYEMQGKASDVTKRLGLGGVNIVFDGNLVGIRDESKFLIVVEAVDTSRGMKFFAEFDWNPSDSGFFPPEVSGLCGSGFSAVMAMQDLFEKLVQIREILHQNEKKSRPGDPDPKSLNWINEVFEFAEVEPSEPEAGADKAPAVNSPGGCFFEGFEFQGLSTAVEYSWCGDIYELTSRLAINQLAGLSAGLATKNEKMFRISLVARKKPSEPTLFYARIVAPGGRGMPSSLEMCCGWHVDTHGAVHRLFYQVQFLATHLQHVERLKKNTRVDDAALSWLREAFVIHPLPESSESKVETIFGGINYQEAGRVNVRSTDASLSTIAVILECDTDRLLARGTTKIADESGFDIRLICIEGEMFEWPIYLSMFDNIIEHPTPMLPKWIQQICGFGFGAQESVQSLLESHGNNFVNLVNASDNGTLNRPEDIESLAWYEKVFGADQPWNPPIDAEYQFESEWEDPASWGSFQAEIRAADEKLFSQWTEGLEGSNYDWQAISHIKQIHDGDMIIAELSLEDVERMGSLWNGFRAVRDAAEALPVVDADEFPDHYRKLIDSEIVNTDKVQLNRWLWMTAGSCDKYIPYKAIVDLHDKNNNIRNFVDSDMKRIFDAWQNFKRFRDGEAIYSSPPVLLENKTKKLEREIFQADSKLLGQWIEFERNRGIHQSSVLMRIELVNQGTEHLYSSDSDDFIKQIESAWRNFIRFEPRSVQPNPEETFDLSLAIAEADPSRLKAWALSESGKMKSTYKLIAIKHLQDINRRQITLSPDDSPETVQDVKAAWDGFLLHEKIHDELNQKIEENKKLISQLDPGSESLPPAIGEGEQISGKIIQGIPVPDAAFGPDVDLRESAFDDVTPYSEVRAVPQVELVKMGLIKMVENIKTQEMRDHVFGVVGLLELRPQIWPSTESKSKVSPELVYTESLYDAMNRTGGRLKIQVDREANAQIQVIRYPHATGFIASIACGACTDYLFSVYGADPAEAIRHLLGVLWATRRSLDYVPCGESGDELTNEIFDRMLSIRSFTSSQDSIPLALISEHADNASLPHKAPENPAFGAVSKFTSLGRSDYESPSVLSDGMVGKDFGHYAGVDSKSPTGWGLLTRSKVVEIKSICSELYFFEPGFLVELIESEPGAKLPWAARPFLFPQVGFSCSMDPRRCIENMMRNLVSEMESLILFSDFRNEYGKGKADRQGFYPETRDEQVRFLTERYFRSYKTRLGYSSSLDFEYRSSVPEESCLFREVIKLKWLEVDFVCEIDKINLLGDRFQYQHLVLIWVDRGDSETPPVFKAALRIAPHIWMGQGKTQEDAVASLLSKIHDSYERYLASGDMGGHSDSQYIYRNFETHCESKKNDRIHFQIKTIFSTDAVGWEDWILENGFTPTDDKNSSRDVLILDQQGAGIHSEPVEVAGQRDQETAGLSAQVRNDTAKINLLASIERSTAIIEKSAFKSECLLSSIQIATNMILQEKLNAAWWNRYFGTPFKIVFSIAFMWLFFMVARLYLEYFIGFWE